MTRQLNLVAALGGGCLAAACASPPVAAPAAPAPSPRSGLEEIYVLRSIREPHTPTEGWCDASKTGFEPFPAEAERAFSFWSVATTAANGQVTDTKASRVATLRGCFGPTSEPARQRFYAEVKLPAISFHGKGECNAVRVNFPEPQLFPVHCWLLLDELPAGYVGGLLTTNTLTSKAPYGGETDPLGYTQASIATIRLWRSR
jgi:hypothetical protein